MKNIVRKISRREALKIGVGLSISPLLLKLENDNMIGDLVNETTTQEAAMNGEIIQRTIPSSGEKLPIVGLGTWRTFDVDNSKEERNARRDVLKMLVAKQASVIDSSPMYGSSETVVGDLSAELNMRNKLFLATKVWTSGRQAGIDQMNDSIRKMNARTIDLMQVHNLVDAKTHIKTLKEWKEQGKTRYWGITHYVPGAYEEMMRYINDEKPDFVQFNYNLSAREAENELLPMAKDKGVAVIINRPFQEGALFSLVQNKTLPAWVKDHDIKTWAQFFLKYIISHPAVTCAIPGTSKANHLEENIGAAFGKLPDDTTRKKMADHFKTL